MKLLGKPVALALVACLATIAPVVSGSALAYEVIARVELSSQTMTVIHQGVEKYRWKVSTARRGKVTPTGRWTAKWLARHHRSSLYNNAPMPYSIFYNGNFAIHGTDQVSKLGRPASAGCIRLHPRDAAVLFQMTRQAGLENMLVEVVR
jgi:lipoprotein-anchoring transpeptidase ErfK/SrfK